MSDTLDDVPEGWRVVIEQDQYREDPRKDFDHVGHLTLKDGRRDLPDEMDDFTYFNEAIDRGGLRLAIRYLTLAHNAVVLPVWGYEHGGLTITAGERTYPYSDVWDSGLLGLAVVTREEMTKAWLGEYPGDDAAVALLKAEVTEYDQYLTGDVWCYAIEQWHECIDSCKHCPGGAWEHVDSCSGLYGSAYAETEARQQLTHFTEEATA